MVKLDDSSFVSSNQSSKLCEGYKSPEFLNMLSFFFFQVPLFFLSFLCLHTSGDSKR